MKKIILQLRMAVKTVMIALLLGVVGKMYAYDFSAVCETGQTLYYNISGSNVTITHPNTYIEEPWSGYTEPEGIIVLPSSVTNNSVTYSVTSIGNYAFRECTFISFVNIPNSVVSIGNSAFEDCWNLTSVNIPNSVNRIGTSAFSGCSKINVFNIPNSVNSIGKEAFWGTGWYNNQANDILYLNNWCLGYKGNAPSGQLEIQDGTRNIANGAFRECIHLTAVNIPNSLLSTKKPK